MKKFAFILILIAVWTHPIVLAQGAIPQQEVSVPTLSRLQAEAVERIDQSEKLTQEIVDSLFSFSELGFQEFETQRYLV